ncbi:hypothetical protein DAPPUDRAFT_312308 [Daphnia pulex]|uniref:Metalloendopeptidase n=1 Tax=Daphnia pulex TaxID=6669 RepID=E9G0E9_DAPPU|nr:hypothetical protein DAPPUDRAFT_312308 [Daphnia pulex]|eukprot:EFX86892.1 hypothetical protein DAPPUDRAFT_312308 [Daphnia pulex]
MTLPKVFNFLVISLVLSFWLIRTVASKPILTQNREYDDQSEDLNLGEPLTEQELNSIISIKAGEEYESEDFIPWTQQDPELFGGDIKLTERKNALMSSRARWPTARIPYVLASDYTPRQREIIANAVSAFHNLTCIRFVPRTTERNYIRIKKTGEGCWSFVGRIGRRQTVGLDDKCLLYSRPGLVIHELMHVLGFYHEHQRPDRDEYVSVDLDNVEPKNKRYFEKMRISHYNILGHSYDYGSVMHYPKDAFAKDHRKPVMTPVTEGTSVLGNRKTFSTADVEKLNTLYCNSHV